MHASSAPRARLFGGALVLAALLALAAFTAGRADPLDAPPAAWAAPALGATLPDTVRVYVVWGSSNACGDGDETKSPNPDSTRAKEWFWLGTQPVRRLDDPTPCRGRVGTDDPLDPSQGSAWPAFADFLLDRDAALGYPTDLALFMSSAARGATLVDPSEDARLRPMLDEAD